MTFVLLFEGFKNNNDLKNLMFFLTYVLVAIEEVESFELGKYFFVRQLLVLECSKWIMTISEEMESLE